MKADTKEYNSILVNNPLYIEIKLNRAKIFNRQLKHDLALKELTLLRKVAEIRKETYQNSSLLAMVFEEEAQVKLCSGETEAFEENILNAIDIREGEMGRFNIPNAVSYSNLFKFMLNLNDEATALKYHLQAA